MLVGVVVVAGPRGVAQLRGGAGQARRLREGGERLGLAAADAREPRVAAQAVEPLAAAPRLSRLYVEGNPLTFPGPEVYERGGNAAVLRFIQDVRRTAEEEREMREARRTPSAPPSSRPRRGSAGWREDRSLSSARRSSARPLRRAAA